MHAAGGAHELFWRATGLVGLAGRRDGAARAVPCGARDAAAPPWSSHLHGYTVGDCAALDQSSVSLVLTRDARDGLDPPVRIVTVTRGDARGPGRVVRHEARLDASEIAAVPDAARFVAVDVMGRVLSGDATRATRETRVPIDISRTPIQASVTAVARVGGTVFAVGWPRRVWRRRGAGTWAAMDQGLPLPSACRGRDLDAAAHEPASTCRFRTVAGFGESDVYVGGDDGELWHWNAVAWRRCRFPSTDRIDAAVAAGHQLFVATGSGAVWRGRGDAWQLVLDNGGPRVRDLAWFDDCLWAGMDGGGLWTIDGRTRPRRPAGVRRALAERLERLDVTPGGTHLLASGPAGAAVFDGERWDVLVEAAALP
ncbi:MAG: hypothetical protein AB7O28_09000 [Vicinamibacterales bacterium]